LGVHQSGGLHFLSVNRPDRISQTVPWKADGARINGPNKRNFPVGRCCVTGHCAQEDRAQPGRELLTGSSSSSALVVAGTLFSQFPILPHNPDSEDDKSDERRYHAANEQQSSSMWDLWLQSRNHTRAMNAGCYESVKTDLPHRNRSRFARILQPA
jgi:hypothetical protein